MLFIALTIIAALFGFLSALTIVLLGGVTFSRGQRKRFPWLANLDGKQLHLTAAVIGFLLLFYVSQAAREISKELPQFDLGNLRSGTLTQRATSAALESEGRQIALDRAAQVKVFFDAAELDFTAGRYKDATGNYKKALDIQPSMAVNLNLGIALQYVGESQEAVQNYMAGLTMARNRRNREYEAIFLDDIAMVYRQDGRLPEALQYAQSALELFRPLKNDIGIAIALTNLGNIYSDLGKNELAVDTLNQALPIFKRIGNFRGQANVWNSLGVSLSDMGKLVESVKAHETALEVSKQAGYLEGQANALVNVGGVYHDLGRLDDSTNAFKEALRLYEQMGIQFGRAAALTNLAIIYNEKQDWVSALEYARKSQDLAAHAGNVPSEANALTAICDSQRHQGALKEALESCEMSVKKANASKSPAIESVALITLGQVYADMRQWADAQQSFAKSVEVSIRSDLPLVQANALGESALAYSRAGNRQEAVDRVARSLKMYDDHGVSNKDVDAYRNLLEQLKR